MAPTVPNPWARTGEDPVRDSFETAHFEAVLDRLLAIAPGRRMLDLGCGDGLIARLAGFRLDTYLGLDLFPQPGVPALCADLRDGLGPAASERFEIYLGTFGIASHLAPAELQRLLREIAATAAPGAVVALEALGLWSLEWPRVWDEPAGTGRTLAYRLNGEVQVHPWSAAELRDLFAEAGIRYLGALDRSVQAGPKTGDSRYWPGMPPLRDGLAALLRGDVEGARPLHEHLPPLPAHPAARVHHALAAARRALLRRHPGPQALARGVWRLEPRGGHGLGHGVLALGRVDDSGGHRRRRDPGQRRREARPGHQGGDRGRVGEGVDVAKRLELAPAQAELP